METDALSRQFLRQEIERLDTPSSYFSAISELAQSEDISQKKAWEIIESQRVELGLREKYTSFESFRVCKYLFYKKLNQNKTA